MRSGLYQMNRATPTFWRATKGAEMSRKWGSPHRWEDLEEESNRADVPKLLLTERFPDLVLPFLLVYPHRGRPELMRFVERVTALNFGLEFG